LIDPIQRLNVNLAAPTTDMGLIPASLGIALARLGSDVLLDMELSALEQEGKGEIISNPRLVTTNQQSAYIESGEEIPYQEATTSGATSVQFKKAVLSLQVTPQITPDDNIILSLKVSQDSRGVETAGIPAINTQQIETNVLVKNGETIVLGGIYQLNSIHKVTRVPFFGSLPWIGVLFRQKQMADHRKELLIFVTPKIIKQKPLIHYA
jgi:type IV pilus assembly protein PilQ